MGRLLIAGSSNIDLTAIVPTLPRPGETVGGATLVRANGGKGANQAVAAGDVYNGALLTALSEGRSLTESALFASRAAAISVTRIGAQSSVPYRNEIEE